jgi:DNA repair protein RadA/Sms
VRSVYRCTECAAEYARWEGRCATCGEWNTLVEELAARAPASARLASGRIASRVGEGVAGAEAIPTKIGEIDSTASARFGTGIGEFDFVLGGGVVRGSMVLVGGEPGIGKSTLLLQVAAGLELGGFTTLYVSGEESPLQVKLRADRLTGGAAGVRVLSTTSLETVLEAADRARPQALIVDSIQTIFTEELEGAPGNVGQVRECAARLMRFAKEGGTTVFLVGHVTKGGGIAGPKTLEHIVDTVLYFEGDGMLDHRVLRATKNRFGSVDEIGVFRMSAEGLLGVPNPSALFLGDRASTVSGSAVTALIEGTRPVLVEVQALAAKAGFGTPQRVATGFDGRRLALLLAVLEKRAGLAFNNLDVFLNIVGGLRIQEPAGDLAVAAALASSAHDRRIDGRAVFLGEVGLSGEIRPVSQADRRLAEAANLGMSTAYVSARAAAPHHVRGIAVVGVQGLADLFDRLFT